MRERLTGGELRLREVLAAERHQSRSDVLRVAIAPGHRCRGIAAPPLLAQRAEDGNTAAGAMLESSGSAPELRVEQHPFADVVDISPLAPASMIDAPHQVLIGVAQRLAQHLCDLDLFDVRIIALEHQGGRGLQTHGASLRRSRRAGDVFDANVIERLTSHDRNDGRRWGSVARRFAAALYVAVATVAGDSPSKRWITVGRRCGAPHRISPTESRALASVRRGAVAG